VLKKISEDTKNSMVQEKGADSINRKGAQSWHTEHVYNVETLYPTSCLYICFSKMMPTTKYPTISPFGEIFG
jgi:hypothetical protein